MKFSKRFGLVVLLFVIALMWAGLAQACPLVGLSNAGGAAVNGVTATTVGAVTPLVSGSYVAPLVVTPQALAPLVVTPQFIAPQVVTPFVVTHSRFVPRRSSVIRQRTVIRGGGFF